MEKTREYTVDRAVGIKDFLRTNAGLSATCIKKVKYGGVYKNGKSIHMREMLSPGDVIRVCFPAESPAHAAPIKGDLCIVYEDDCLLAVNKPCGMPIHPSRGHHTATLANLIAAYPGANGTFHAIGRLDRDTSGIVLLAKDAVSAYRLSEAMKAGRFTKEYLALTEGVPTPLCGRIDAPIAREHEGALRRVVRADGKPSVTEYRVLTQGDRALVQVHLLTGRTHQIRVHMAHIGYPLYADALYGHAVENTTFSLHACRLSFPHPSDGHPMHLVCPAPFAPDVPLYPVHAITLP